MTKKPFLHQQKLLDLNPDRHLLAWQTQVGKTLASIWLANKRNYSVLIITRKGLVKQWEKELAENSKNEYLVLSKEHFKKQWNTLPKYETVIYDEVNDVLGPQKTNKKGQHTLARTFAYYIKRHEPAFRYYLSATPYTSTPWSIYRLAHLLGHDWDYAKFAKYFFNEKKQRYRRCPKGRCVGCKMCCRLILVPKEHRKEDMRKVATQLGSAVKMKDCYDMPKEIYRDVRLNLTPEQKKAIKENSDIGNHVAKHRIECGHVSGDGYVPDVYLKNEIDDKLIEYASEFDKLAIVCRFRAQVKQIEALFPNRKTIVLWGGMNDFHEKPLEAEEAENCSCIIQADMSSGYALHSFEALVFASCSYSYVNFEQVHGRIRHVGRKSPCLYIYLIAGEVGEKVLESVRSKRDYNP